MTLKPLQHAKQVGVEWTPSFEFVSNVVQPLMDPKYHSTLRGRGRIVMRSMGSFEYDGMHINHAAHFDDKVGEVWRRRDLARAQVDSITRKYLEKTNMYSFRLHLAPPHGQKQRDLIDPNPKDADIARNNMHESVFFGLHTAMLNARGDDIASGLEQSLMVVRANIQASLAEKAIERFGYLNEPRAYIVPYKVEEADALAKRLEDMKHFKRDDLL